MKLIIACDCNGIELKKHLVKELSNTSHQVTDAGVFDGQDIDYPEIGAQVAARVRDKEFDRGILICGTGIGMALVANKVKGAYAAVCHDAYSTERSILSNNANIMCIGALVVGKALAATLVRQWLELVFVESPSSRKIMKLKEIESEKYAVTGPNGQQRETLFVDIS